MRSDVVHIDNGVVVKRYDANVEVEYEKAVAFWEVSRRGEFVAPRPLSVDVSARKIVYAFIDGMQSVRLPFLQYARNTPGATGQLDVFRSAGWALASIHEHMKLTTSTTWQPSAAFALAMKELGVQDIRRVAARMPSAFMHGDFGFSNVQRMGGSGDRIAVIDCSTDNYTTFASDTIAPVYLDVAHMVACMEGLFSLSHYPFVSWSRVAHLREAFLGAYEEGRGIPLDRAWVSRFAYASVVAKFHKEFRSPLLRKMATGLVFNRFKDNMPQRESGE